VKRWHVVIVIVACIAVIAYLALVVGRGAFPKHQTVTVLPICKRSVSSRDVVERFML
jgi:hypothetical protein